MQFKIGETVRFLHEVGSGKILEIKSNSAILEDENGFEMEYPFSQLVPSMQASEDELLGKVESQSKINLTIKKPLFTPKYKGEKEWKLDLHMENLTDSHKNMTNHEILTVQLNHFKKFIKTAEEAKVGRMVIVHGVGTGKLKNEILQLVRGINGAELFDADYSEYGRGASILERKYNIR
jgi:nucleoside 2-deoxyribosyltransferase|tara:strand:- start:26766 stop:27302 length:537 start_codon:yes stop_codon:yes gene_type:complete